MALYLVRHGETDWNLEKRFQSSSDVPLNATGLAQARAVRRELAARNVQFAAAFCSPLSRAWVTAGIILEGSGLAAEAEPEFTELSFGRFEGRLESELRLEFGDRYSAWRASNYTESGPAGGDNIVAAASRVGPALQRRLAAAGAGDVLVVAHQAVMMAMKVALTGRTDAGSAAEFRQNNDEVDVWDPQSGERIERFRVLPA